MTTAPRACDHGHLTHLRRGRQLYGWDYHTDRWDICDPTPARPTPPKSVFFTVIEVARMMGVSKMTVYRLTERGELDHVRVGRSIRIPQKALREYLGRAA